MIRLQQVVKTYTHTQTRLPILHIPEWTVREGERLALLGPSGCGKSTLLHLLSGILTADGGEITVCGMPLHRMGEAERDRFRASRIGYIMQDFHLIGSLTARQNVELTLDVRLKGKSRRRLLEEWFGRVGLEERMDHLPSQLSRGQQQRVAMIRALINRPALVLADEPTGSLDWETAGETMRLLLELSQTEGATLVTVTHDLHLAELYPVRVQMESLNAAVHPGRRQPVRLLEDEVVGA
ncbi:ABC transporter ATP-binding protein [Gorillibacterium sp. sgz5001074]|uniref:ABC transporter ATP-binding protein n=1 Tax=Gorillibacterium sp. sgz5001074 TaxID=3446695 RepID=UPI003F66161C